VTGMDSETQDALQKIRVGQNYLTMSARTRENAMIMDLKPAGLPNVMCLLDGPASGLHSPKENLAYVICLWRPNPQFGVRPCTAT
jgi:hypothetical protein